MKYMGSKSRIKKHIIPILQDIINKNNITSFVDLFCGGCNIIDDIICYKRYANDKSKPLIALLKHVSQNGRLLSQVSKDVYDYIRKNDKNPDIYDWIKGNIGFLASYNGRYFDGGYAKSGYENGKLRDYYQESKKNLELQSNKLKGVIFTDFDYSEFKGKNMLVYCDIPYKNTKQYNTSKDFNHDDFWEHARNWSKNNIVVISELQAPDDFVCIWKQEVTRSIKANDKTKSMEKLFIHNTLINYLNK